MKIFCENNSQYYDVAPGCSLSELSSQVCSSVRHRCCNESDSPMEIPVLAALVDNKLKELDYALTEPHEVRFIGYDHPDGRRTYVRSLCFVLQNAVRELFPDKVLAIDYSLPSGLYCEIREKTPHEDGRPMVYKILDEEIDIIKAKMQAIIQANLPFSKEKMQKDEAMALYIDNNQPEKAALIQTIGRYSVNVYFLGGQADTFYGPLVPSTGYLKYFDLMGFNEGFCLQFPMEGSISKVLPMKRQSLLASALEEHSDWCNLLSVRGLGVLNKVTQHHRTKDLINLSEALHERKYAAIADQIYARRESVKIVFIAGPSSSGKTSTSKRLALQCRILGLIPKVIELDNYFVDRELTPKDENGEYDFESLYAMDLDLLNNQLNDLLAGKEVEIPKFDFKQGKRYYDGTKMKLEDKDILIMEGIHALNPEMTSGVDNSRIFRVYASALTSLSIDENNNISTSDNRMLRRMIRDNRTRGVAPDETIMRWASVRRGENRNIFPFQENADAIFNSAHIFELPVLKYYAEPFLRRISPDSPAYTEAVRLLKFLSYVVEFTPEEIAAIPPTSILREFIDGQTL